MMGDAPRGGDAEDAVFGRRRLQAKSRLVVDLSKAMRIAEN
jgi:hypothetical protein